MISILFFFVNSSLQDYLVKYPDAKYYCAPEAHGLIIKEIRNCGIPYPSNGIDVLGDQPPSNAWNPKELEHHVFKGYQKLNEVVLFHKSSNTLLTTDLALNFTDDIIKLKYPQMTPFGIHCARWLGVYNQIGITKMVGYSLSDKTLARQSLDTICKWDFKAMGMAHGRPVPASAGIDVKGQWKSSWDKLL